VVIIIKTILLALFSTSIFLILLFLNSGISDLCVECYYYNAQGVCNDGPYYYRGTSCPDSNSCSSTKYTCCTSLSLSLSPNLTSPSSTVSANICAGPSLANKVTTVKDSSGNTVCSCTLSPFTCSCTFTAPSSPGTYTYYVYAGTSSASSTLSVKYCKSNPYSGKTGCCDYSDDCVDYDGNCVRSGSWGKGNGLPLDYCYKGDWKLGYCVQSEEACLQTAGIEYTSDTSGCVIYSLGCYPYDREFVVTSVIECSSDRNCPGYDPNTHLKRYCDTDTHTCKPLTSCSANKDCEDGWCCDKLVGGAGSCKRKGEIVQYGGKSYICDPPEGFVSLSNKNTNTQANKKLTLLDLLINPFSYFFKK
jgi:hypothetical protein